MSTIDLGAAFGIKELSGKAFPAKKSGERTPSPVFDYVFRMDILRKMLAWAGGIVTTSIYISGPAGSGKTSLVEQVAARIGQACTTLSCNSRTEKADIVGYIGLQEGKTAFIEGPLVRAMRLGEWITFDEGDALPPSVTITLNRVLEGSPLVIPETGDVIQPHPDFRVAFTGNTHGRGDTTGQYRSRNVQDAAVLDRFLFVEVGYPESTEELNILTRKCPNVPEDIAAILVQFAVETRNAHEAGELSAALSTRGLCRIGTILDSGTFAKKEDPLWESISFGFADGLSPDERLGVQKILETIKQPQGVQL
ncbi:cobalamin biosynthesis protein CobS [Acidithiobacillus marinus]|uniref:Cobalamin biosynthesis protein CobS n=1 Tax=Acidithiobacillus marinus TaxID=187490 RepID=A0A2I1DPL3_9PROT|nr:AAA family ATPase [Acidithiobacillus marinus]PKY11825.1 cobalamin biosynthesis protein CobS [Acidithiobacillus marinus]